MPDPNLQQLARLLASGGSSMAGTLPQQRPVSPWNFVSGTGSVYMSPFQPMYGNPPGNMFSLLASQLGQLGPMVEMAAGIFAPAINQAAYSRGITPMTGSGGSLRYLQSTMMQSTMADIDNFRLASGQRVSERNAQYLRDALTKGMMQLHPEMDPAKAAEFARDAAANIYSMPMAAVNPLLQSFGLEGFATTSLMTSAIQAGRSMGVPVDLRTAGRTAEAILGRYYRSTPTGTAVNQQYAQGVTINEMGQMMDIMGRQGMLMVKSPDQMATQMGELNKTIRVMRELMGDPDAPIPQIVKNLQGITGGALGRLDPAQVRRMLTSAQTAAEALNIDPASMGRLMQTSALEAQARGMSAVSGSRAALAAVQSVAAARAAAATLGTAGAGGLSRLTPGQELSLAKRRAMTLRTSTFGIGVGTLARLQRDVGDIFGKTPQGAEIAELLEKNRRGTLTETEAQKLMQYTRPAAIRQFMSGLGFHAGEIGRYVDNIQANITAGEETGQYEHSTLMRAQDAAETITRNMSPSTLRRAGLSRAAMVSLVRAALDTGSVERARELIARRLGQSARSLTVGAIIGGMENVAATRFKQSYGGGLTEMTRQLGSEKIIEEGVMSRMTDTAEELRAQFTSAGVVPRSQQLQTRFLRGLASFGMNPDMNKSVIQTLTGILGAGYDTSELMKKVLEPYTAKTAELELRTEIGEQEGTLTGKQLEINKRYLARRKQLGKALRQLITGEPAEDEQRPEESEPAKAVKKEAEKKASRAAVKKEESRTGEATEVAARPVTFNITLDHSQTEQVKHLVIHGEMA